MARTIGLVAWARTVEFVVTERRVSLGTARALLVLLAEHANKRTCSVSLSRAVLAESLNIRVDAVKRALRELDRAGVITRVQVRWRNGWSALSVYYLHHPRCPPVPQQIDLDVPLRPNQSRRRIPDLPDWGTGRQLARWERDQLVMEEKPGPVALALARDGVALEALAVALGVTHRSLMNRIRGAYHAEIARSLPSKR